MDNQLQRDFDKTKAQVQALTDQIRVRLHLAGMDVKDAFHDLEKQAEKIGRSASKTAKTALQDIAGKLQKLADGIDGH